MPHKEEYPALLPLGFHEKTLKELHALCVAPFAERSFTRSLIMQGLEIVAQNMLNAKIEAKLWVDGSFLTKKLDPSDVDILVELRGEYYDSASSDQIQLLEALDANAYKDKLRVDSRTWKFYEDEGHPDYWGSRWWQAYWLKFFGFYSDDGPNSYETKGMALLIFPGCDK